jgi:hypothetical protein
MSKFKKYQRIQIAELRPVTDEEVMSRHLASNISMSMEDKEKGHPYIGDMVARNPENHNDQWLVTEEHFKKNFKPIDDNERSCPAKQGVTCYVQQQRRVNYG